MAKGETYEEFVAKFKKNAPKTTDDCYTPQPVYEVVKEYALCPRALAFVQRLKTVELSIFNRMTSIRHLSS